jgi:hypothetical protein
VQPAGRPPASPYQLRCLVMVWPGCALVKQGACLAKGLLLDTQKDTQVLRSPAALYVLPVLPNRPGTIRQQQKSWGPLMLATSPTRCKHATTQAEADEAQSKRLQQECWHLWVIGRTSERQCSQSLPELKAEHIYTHSSMYAHCQH